MSSIILYHGGVAVGHSKDIDLRVNPSWIDITQFGDLTPQFLAGRSSWSIDATDVQWEGDVNFYITSSIALFARIEEDGMPLMMGEVYIERVDTIIHPISTRTIYNVQFVGHGALSRIAGINSDQIASSDRDTAIGFALSRTALELRRSTEEARLAGDRILAQTSYIPRLIKGNELQGILPHRLITDDNAGITTKVGTKKRSKTSDRKDLDETPRGFKIVP